MVFIQLNLNHSSLTFLLINHTSVYLDFKNELFFTSYAVKDLKNYKFTNVQEPMDPKRFIHVRVPSYF